MSAIKYAGFYFEKYISKKLDIDSSVSMFDAKQISTTGFLFCYHQFLRLELEVYLCRNGNLSIGSLIGFNIFATRALGTISSVQNSFSLINKTNLYLKECKDFF